MKALLVSSRSYVKKATGEPGSVGTLIYLRPDNTVDSKQIFNFDSSTFCSGMLVNAEFDPNGFLMSLSPISNSDAFPLVVEELR